MIKRKYFVLLILVLLFVLVGCTTPSTNPPTNTGGENQTPNTPENPDPVVKETKAKNLLNYISEEGEVPRVFIQTKNSVFPYNKEEYITGSF